LQAAFNPSQTDLVLRVAFPALVANLVREIRGDDRVAMGSALPPGTVLTSAPQGAAGSGGAGHAGQAGAGQAGAGQTGAGQTGPGQAPASGSQRYALEPGIYRTPDGRLLLASLDSEAESRLPGPAPAAGGGGGSQRAPAAAPAAQGGPAAGHAIVTSLAAALLILALLALAAEWLLYSGGGRAAPWSVLRRRGRG